MSKPKSSKLSIQERIPDESVKTIQSLDDKNLLSRIEEVDNDLSTVNKANKMRLENIEEELKEQKETNEELDNQLEILLQNSEKLELADALEMQGLLEDLENRKVKKTICKEDSWKETVDKSRRFLSNEGIDPNEIFHFNIISQKELFEIIDFLDRPLYERIKWDKYDFLVCFGSGILGGFVDLLMCTPGKFLEGALANKGTWIGKYVESIHKLHPPNAPIDFQGSAHVEIAPGEFAEGSFGGGFHRGRTSGHDLLRFFSCVRQMTTGKFEGVFFRDGMKIPFESGFNQFGTPYIPMQMSSAFLECFTHNFCDFFSSHSLPIPGTSILFENSGRELRKILMNELYHKGINLRHLTLQTIPPFVVTAGVILYFMIRYGKIDAPEDAKSQKLFELLALSHSITCAFNIGKVIVMKDPYQLNVIQVIATCLSLAKVILMETRRNSFIQKIKRNNLDLANDLTELQKRVDFSIKNEILLI